MKPSIKYINPNYIETLKQSVKILLISATELEKNIILAKLKPIYEDNILILQSDNYTYTIGRLGLYPIVHVQSNMGSASTVDASIFTTNDSITKWEPKLIIMLGIAFGIDNSKQHIGDVLISESIIQYEPSKIYNGNFEYRGNIISSGRILLDRFRNYNFWTHKINEKYNAEKICGKILSGEKLIDDPNFKQTLLNYYKDAIGGEMEGVGVALSSLHSHLNEWIVIKGICDWATNKYLHKKNNQRIAMESVISLCEKVLSVEYTFLELGIESLSQIELQHTEKRENTNNNTTTIPTNVFNNVQTINIDQHY